MKLKKVLDIGCGEGYNVNLLSKTKQNRVIGIELSKKTVEEAQQRFPNLDIRQMSAEKLKFKNQEFDEIYAFEVLEHVDHLETVAKEINRVLAKHGKLTLSVPFENSEHLLLKIRPTYFKEIHHVRIFKGNEMEKLMNKYGLKLVSKKRVGFLLHVHTIYQFLTTKSSGTQLAIGNWRRNIFSKAVYYGLFFFNPNVLKTPGKYLPIWAITLPVGYTLNYFGNKVLPKSIYYEFIKTT